MLKIVETMKSYVIKTFSQKKKKKWLFKLYCCTVATAKFQPLTKKQQALPQRPPAPFRGRLCPGLGSSVYTASDHLWGNGEAIGETNPPDKSAESPAFTAVLSIQTPKPDSHGACTSPQGHNHLKNRTSAVVSLRKCFQSKSDLCLDHRFPRSW